jgi:hypothetical protein
MNEPDDAKARLIARLKRAAGKDALGRATLARARETERDSHAGDLEKAFHWSHFKDLG